MAATQEACSRLTDAQFGRISDWVQRLCGIHLHDGKRELVKARLAKRLRELRLSDYDQYVEYVRRDPRGTELQTMMDCLATNLTYFFRESMHFEYLRQTVVPRVLSAGGERSGLRVWSAGCSSGEEPYSIAMVLDDAFPELCRGDVRILATDLSSRALATARHGVYGADRVAKVPPRLRDRYFHPVRTEGGVLYRVAEPIRKLVTFARLNLIDPWPMKGRFDAIFCRNVMIYFDKPTRVRLVHRLVEMLAPGGCLCVGHSESLMGSGHRLRYAAPAAYEKT